MPRRDLRITAEEGGRAEVGRGGGRWKRRWAKKYHKDYSEALCVFIVSLAIISALKRCQTVRFLLLAVRAHKVEHAIKFYGNCNLASH